MYWQLKKIIDKKLKMGQRVPPRSWPNQLLAEIRKFWVEFFQVPPQTSCVRILRVWAQRSVLSNTSYVSLMRAQLGCWLGLNSEDNVVAKVTRIFRMVSVCLRSDFGPPGERNNLSLVQFEAWLEAEQYDYTKETGNQRIINAQFLTKKKNAYFLYDFFLKPGKGQSA